MRTTTRFQGGQKEWRTGGKWTDEGQSNVWCLRETSVMGSSALLFYSSARAGLHYAIMSFHTTYEIIIKIYELPRVYFTYSVVVFDS